MTSPIFSLNSNTSPIPTDEPAELSVNIPLDLIEVPAKRFNRPRVKWNVCSTQRALVWREDGAVLYVKYFSGPVKTTWTEMVELSELPESKQSTRRNKIIGKKWTANKRTALKAFSEKLASGEIVDPDAAYRKMLKIETVPDSNCGSVENVQGAY
ncbi:hypothetical protein [Bacteroides sp.]|uniref:hypothetical protein n=1 Tax=Bacteroides sp. TaxID=29523 RepID=UPI0026120657|nr:hypothetical protein [Bacteroides sp.]MDD3040991.1 hypothetical protein [Bacteroides sp.]